MNKVYLLFICILLQTVKTIKKTGQMYLVAMLHSRCQVYLIKVSHMTCVINFNSMINHWKTILSEDGQTMPYITKYIFILLLK